MEISMIFDDDAFKACIAEISPSHLDRFEEVRESVICSSNTIGALRYFNSLNDADLNFKGFAITKVWDVGLSGHWRQPKRNALVYNEIKASKSCFFP